jgi:hypothetical protein
LTEVREALAEAGFDQVAVWWTETQSEEEEADDGVYEYRQIDLTRQLPNAASWCAYICARVLN